MNWKIYLWLYSPCAPWCLFQFLNPIHSRQDSLDGGLASRKAATYTQNKHTDKNASSGIRTHDPSVRAGEDGSCHYNRNELEDMWKETIVAYFKATFQNLSGVSEENRENLNTVVGVSADIELGVSRI
jgi:hypothetical protein